MPKALCRPIDRGWDVMQRTVFSSEDLDARLDDRARLSLWNDIYTSRYGGAEIDYLPDRPFSSRSTFVQFGPIGVAQYEGTISRFSRTKRHLAADTVGGFKLAFNRGPSAVRHSQYDEELLFAPGTALLHNNSDAKECWFEGVNSWIGLYVPEPALLLDLVSDAEDLVCTVLDATLPSAWHLRRYMEFLVQSNELGGDAALSEKAGMTLLDLLALSLGASGDAAELAGLRGLRTVRVHEILSEIKRGLCRSVLLGARRRDEAQAVAALYPGPFARDRQKFHRARDGAAPAEGARDVGEPPS